MKLRITAFAIGLSSVMGVFLSFIHPWGNVFAATTSPGPILGGATVPAEVRQVLESKCGDCHSEKTRRPVYSHLAPVSWLVERDIHEGREHLNLSRWQQYTLESQTDLLTKIGLEARSGRMPVKQYLLIHPQARLSDQEQQLLYLWSKAERKRIQNQVAAAQ